MKKLLLPILAAVAIHASAAEPIPNLLQDISVTVKSGSGSGSGVIFTRTNKTGEVINFVWTAAHVVDNLRSERSVIAPDGSKKTVVEFADAQVVKILTDNGRAVGKLEMDCEIIKYSDADNGEDLCLMRLRKPGFVKASAVFFLSNSIPVLGTDLYHVGSLLGEMGANSMTSGIVSQHGRLIGKKVFDQTTVTSFPGSSGGGVYLRNGQYIGMLVRGAGEGFNLIVPIRRIHKWAKQANIEWALDYSVKLPDDEALKALPIEDNPFRKKTDKK